MKKWRHPPKEYGGLKNKLADVKNIVTCEAHLEMVKENYRILNDGDEEVAKEYREKIIELSKMPL